MKPQAFENVFNQIREYIEFQKARRMRGLNDYNVFTSLLSISDEVRLHSRFLHSLLNPDGDHFLGTLFLQKFIETIKLDNLQLNYNQTIVLKEYKNIDLYISDGQNHLIIENKIYAADQDKQIERYITSIKKENDEDANIFVLYLSPGRPKPSRRSMGELHFSKNSNALSKNGIYIADYKSIDYCTHITSWLDKITYEVSNLTNLSVVISQYREVVAHLCDTYRSKSMKLQEFIKSKPIEDYEEILNQLDKLQVETHRHFMEELLRQMQSSSVDIGFNNERILDIYFGKYTIRFLRVDDRKRSLRLHMFLRCQIIEHISKGKDAWKDPLEPTEKSKVFGLLSSKGFNSGWKGSYGVKDLGEISFQNKNNLIEACEQTYEDVTQILKKLE